MARLLVKAIDHTHPATDIDRQGAYKRGDVVVVMPDGHVWGRAEVVVLVCMLLDLCGAPPAGSQPLQKSIEADE